MQNKKKWLVLILVVLICVGVAPRVQAEETIEKYYGSMLSQDEQQYYMAMQKSYIGTDELPQIMNEEIEVELSGMLACTTMEQLQEEVHKQTRKINNAYIAFVWDYPQVFWTQGVTASYGYYENSDGTYKLASASITFVNSYEITQEELTEYNKGIQEVVDDIGATMSEKATAHDYYKAIHDWICDKNVYNYDALSTPQEHLEAYTSYPVFTEEADAFVVCEGYGEAYKILCDQFELKKEIGLNCVLMIGLGVSSDGQENHLWNAVKMPDDKWYGVDTTWDDQEARIYNYFLCGQMSVGLEGLSFAKDHLEETQVTSLTTVEYPEIATYGYGVKHNYEWNYEEGTLRVMGIGELPDYLVAEGAPWYEYKDEITSVIIGNGTSFIPEGLLANYQNVEKLEIPFLGATADSRDAYDSVLGYIFGRGNEGVPQYFEREGEQVKYYSYKIPETLHSVCITGDADIPFGAFSNCVNITDVEFSNQVTYIGDMAFYGCTGLKEVKFTGNAPDIQSNTFYRCGEVTVFIPEGDSTWTMENMVDYGAEDIRWQLYEAVRRGDVNDDNVVNNDDAVYLLYHLMLPERYPISQNGDFDGNGIFNSDDAIYLLNLTSVHQ